MENLRALTRVGYLSVAENESFFLELFKRNSYIQGEEALLFKEAVARHPPLFCQLASCRLLIDPFSRQVAYSQWLKDTSKFRFIATLRGTPGVADTPCAADFDAKLSDFQALYRHVREFRREKYG